MKEIQKEIKGTRTLWQAVDGTEFNDKNECQKYEESAAAVLMAKLVECEVAREYEHGWFDASEENNYRTVKPRNQEDIDTLNQLWFMFGGKNTEKPKFSSDDIAKFFLIGHRFCCNKLEWVWFYSFDEMVEAMTGDKYRAEMIKTKE